MKKIVLLLCSLLVLSVTDVLGAPIFQKNKKGTPLIYAHRGNSDEYPENTILSFNSAIELGADVNEMDAYLTKDGVAVIIHDATVDRTTNGTGRVIDYTLAELKTLDAGYKFTTDGGQTYPYRGKGITVPTLTEVFQEVTGGKFNIDMKLHRKEMAEAVAKDITATGAEDRCIVGSFNDLTAGQFRELLPDVASFSAMGEAVQYTLLFFRDRPEEHEPKSQVFELPTGYVLDLEGYIAAANANGQDMAFWTINDEDEMRELLQKGADGIITDNVRGAVKVFQELGHKP